jgi:hypothetical protein
MVIRALAEHYTTRARRFRSGHFWTAAGRHATFEEDAGMTNRDIERYYFQQFSEAYELPRGALEYADRPDVLLRGARTIGIEITRFYLQSGRSLSSEQQQRPRRERVVLDAHTLHRAAGGRRVELTITFDASRPITSAKGKTLPKQLAAFTATIGTHESGMVDAERLEEMPEVHSIYVSSKEYDDAKWSVCQVYSLDLMSAEGLKDIVKQKESKSAEYAPCDAYWLLIIVDWRDNAQDQEISVERVKIASEIFERIIVYKPGFEDIVEVWP